MKTISVNVSESVYQKFLDYAKSADRTVAELIREAMEQYRHERIHPRASVLELKPLNLGKMLRPLNQEEDNLGEMLNDPRP